MTHPRALLYTWEVAGNSSALSSALTLMAGQWWSCKWTTAKTVVSSPWSSQDISKCVCWRYSWLARFWERVSLNRPPQAIHFSRHNRREISMCLPRSPFSARHGIQRHPWSRGEARNLFWQAGGRRVISWCSAVYFDHIHHVLCLHLLWWAGYLALLYCTAYCWVVWWHKG